MSNLTKDEKINLLQEQVRMYEEHQKEREILLQIIAELMKPKTSVSFEPAKIDIEDLKKFKLENQ